MQGISKTAAEKKWKSELNDKNYPRVEDFKLDENGKPTSEKAQSLEFVQPLSP